MRLQITFGAVRCLVLALGAARGAIKTLSDTLLGHLDCSVGTGEETGLLGGVVGETWLAGEAVGGVGARTGLAGKVTGETTIISLY